MNPRDLLRPRRAEVPGPSPVPAAARVTCVMLMRWPDRADMIRDALASFHLQTYAARELLIVNEGAPLESRVEGVRVLNTGPTRSLGAQRNLGLREAAGEYVATWDDDDASFDWRLAHQVAMADRGADYVYAHRIWLADEALRPVCLAAAEAYVTALVRRDVALDAGGYPNVNFAEDAALHRAIRAAGGRIDASQEAFYLYRRHGSNVSSRATGEGLDTWQSYCVTQYPTRAAEVQVERLRGAKLPDILRPR